MESFQAHFLTALVVFNNTLNQELIRSLHVYRFEDGKEDEIQREFVFSENGSYVEIEAHPDVGFQGFRVPELFEGRVIGSWLCIFAFHATRPSLSIRFPSLLSISGNPKLKSVPSLVNDLQMISQLSCRTESNKSAQFRPEEVCAGNKIDYQLSKRSLPVLDLDLNCLPYPYTTSELFEDQLTEKSAPGIIVKKKKRAASEDVAKIALEDLCKYFDRPIVEASRNLNVGVTVLKRKCREFGIPRWPHRKIKSLDSLIHDLQDEAERQLQENKAAAMAVAKRQRMLESEKESIERKPFMEIHSETKKFRQDVFKRRHRARALKNQCQSMSPNLEDGTHIL